jgi:hypothetical protein
MKNKIISLLVGLTLLGCSDRGKKVNWNPYYPNYGISKEEIISNGFELSSADGGVCTYVREEANKFLIFSLSFDDNCEAVESQELSISIRKDTTFDPIKYEPLYFTSKDSLLIVDVLDSYKSKKTSNIDKVSDCLLKFQATDAKGKTIEWDVFLCSDHIILSATEKINNGQVTSAKPSTSLLMY